MGKLIEKQLADMNGFPLSMFQRLNHEEIEQFMFQSLCLEVGSRDEVAFRTSFPRFLESLNRRIINNKKDVIPQEPVRYLEEYTERAPVQNIFSNGIYGGFIGGLLAGLVAGIFYYVRCLKLPDVDITPSIILQYTIYSAVLGGVFSASSQLSMIWFKNHGYTAFVGGIGAMIGGCLGGLPAGALGGYYFGCRDNNLPFAGVPLLVGTLLLGTLFIVIGSFYYEFRNDWRRLLKALLVIFTCTPFLALIGFIAPELLGIDAEYFHITRWPNKIHAMIPGAIIGMILGSVIGLQIGFISLLFQKWIEYKE